MKFNAALCLQGGAMRSVFVDGVLDCLIDNNIDILNVFGISASSKDMIYYPTHQKLFAYKANINSINDEKMYNMSNLLLGKPVFNMEHYKEFRDKNYPYKIEEIRDSDFNLYIGASNTRTCEIEYFDKYTSSLDDAILASCSIPVLFQEVNINEHYYLDGGLCENIPFMTAIKKGFDKVIVVATREKGYRDIKPKNDPKDLFVKLKFQNNPNLLSKILNVSSNYNSEMDLLDKLEDEGKIFVLRPNTTKDFDRFEKDNNKLSQLYNDGYNTCLRNLEHLLTYLK
jgi:predicted patatin/cPLA2 family phospholipase